MNKKGFTLVEVVVSFSIISVVLASVITFTIIYRDKVREEEVRTQLLDFKNTITKVVYDDIISEKYYKIEKCEGQAQCVNFIDTAGGEHALKAEIVRDASGNYSGQYINYDGTKYFLPDSDLNKVDGDEIINPMCWLNNDFELSNYEDIYTLKITFEHTGLDEQYEILITIN